MGRGVGRRGALRGVVVAAVIAATGLLTGGTAAAAPAPARGCARVEIVTVRGTGESAGGGFIAGPLATAVQKASTQTVAVRPLSYPASYFPYSGSVRQGVSALQSLLTSRAKACPATTFALIGYSQGAQVIGNVLAQRTVPAASRIKVVQLYGDPTFNSREPYVLGSFTKGRNGIFPRATGTLSRFSPVIRSMCYVSDDICQSGARGDGHFGYGNDLARGTTAIVAKLGG